MPDLIQVDPVNSTGTPTPATVQPAQQQQQQQPVPSQAQPAQAGVVQNDPAAPSVDLTGGQNGLPNLGTPAPAANVHPLVQKANIVRQTALALAGGQRYRTEIDVNTGERRSVPVPMSKSDIGMAIAMEALSGALGGLATPAGPNAAGRAAAAGYGQAVQQHQQADAQQQQQAQQDSDNQASALTRRATIFEANSRILHNTAEAEKLGSDAIDTLVEQNRKAGLLETDSPFVDNNGESMTQQELLQAMQSGKVSSLDHLGPVAGRIEVTDADGTRRWATTHIILKDGDAKVPFTQADANRLAALNVSGFKSSMKIPDGYQVPLRMAVLWNEQGNSHALGDHRLQSLRNTLQGTPAQDSVPSQIDYSQPGMDKAMQRFQTYTSHDAQNSADPYLALQAMGADKRDKDGQMQPNPDAKYVEQIAQAFGGWDVLRAAHDRVLADTEASKRKADADAEVYKQRQLLPVKAATARAEASATLGPKAAAAGAEESARLNAKQAFDQKNNGDALSSPDALGYTPNVPGGVKEYNKRQGTFKKQADALAQTEGTFQQFQNISHSIANGNMTGAQSVVALFDAIGLSATPLAGRGFRVNDNVIREHEQARGWVGALQNRLANVQAGTVITPQQVKDYAAIAAQARHSQYVNLANEVHNEGLGADFVLPTGNGQKIDPETARIFFTLSGSDPNKARAAAAKKGWSF